MQLNPKIYQPDVEQKPNRMGFGEGLLVAGDENPDVVALCCDLKESTRVDLFASKYPNRYVELGAAEQNMAGVAAGLAITGKIPFITSYATFSPGRNWDQIRVSICYSNNNVKIVGSHSGISVGPDGATHQALEDIAITRVLPNLVVIAPCDAIEAKKATIASAKYKGPVYIRLAREKTPIITTEDTPFEIGKSQVFREGNAITVVATGTLVYDALIAAEELMRERAIAVEVINCPTIKPLDGQTILKSVKKTGALITVEEHQIDGGFGSAVCEFISETHPVKVKRIGMPNSFGESGQPRELLEKYGMSKNHIKNAIREMIAQ